MSEDINPELIVYDERLPGGCHWSFILKRGYTLRLTDLEGGANVSALFFNHEERSERYNMADTLKAQHTAFLTKGHVCYSDMGRVLASVTEDTCGWHDTFCGLSNANMIKQKFGDHNYQECRNGYYRNGRDSMLIELGKWGLGKRDLVSNINFFSKVKVDENGFMHYEPDHCEPGGYVDLRAEMNLIVALSAAPHPLHPEGEYPNRNVQMTIWRSGLGGQDDLCRNHCPENQRGFINTENWFAQDIQY